MALLWNWLMLSKIGKISNADVLVSLLNTIILHIKKGKILDLLRLILYYHVLHRTNSILSQPSSSSKTE